MDKNGRKVITCKRNRLGLITETERDRDRDRQTERQRETETDRQTETVRQRETETERQRQRFIASTLYLPAPVNQEKNTSRDTNRCQNANCVNHNGKNRFITAFD